MAIDPAYSDPPPAMLILLSALLALDPCIVNFNGVLTPVETTLVNAYSGDALTLSGSYYINPAPLESGCPSPGGIGVLSASSNNQLLTLEDEAGNVLLTGFDFIFLGGGDDVLDLSSSTQLLGDMTLDGGSGDNVIWANIGDDRVTAYAGNDRLDGGPGDDTITAGAGDDDLRGGPGSDTLDGGPDLDVASYPGSFGDHSVVEAEGVLTITDLVGDQGTDTLINVEQVRFADGTLEGGVFWNLPVETVRVGTPPNPAAFLPGATIGPAIGEVWDPVIDHATFVPDAILDLVLIDSAPLNLPLPGVGTVLCDPAGSIAVVTAAPAPGTPFQLPIADNLTFVGLEFCVQGGSFDSLSVLHLANALDVTIGKE